MNDGNLSHAGQHRRVDEPIQLHNRLVGGHPAQIDLGARGGAAQLLRHTARLAAMRRGSSRPGHTIAFQQPQIGQRHARFDDPRLHLHLPGAVGGRDHDGLFVNVKNQHAVALFQRTRQLVAAVGLFRLHRVGLRLHRADSGAQRRPCLCRTGGVRIFAQRFQFGQQCLRLGAGARRQVAGVGAGAFQFGRARARQFGLVLLCAFQRLRRFGPRLRRRLLLRFQRLPRGFQLLHHVLEPGRLVRHQRPRPIDHRRRNSQPLRNRERVRPPRHADQQPVRRPQRRDVELAARIFHARRLQREFFQLGVVRRRRHARPAAAQRFQNRPRQRRALHRVGARTQLVDQNQAARIGLPQDGFDVRHVRRKRGQRLLDRLLVADVGEHMVEHRQFALLARRNHQPARGHQRQQADGFQRDGFAAGVRAGNHQRVERCAQFQRDGHRRFRPEQRVARPVQPNPPAVVHFGDAGAHLVPQMRLGEDHIQRHRVVVSGDNRVGERPHQLRQFRQNPVNFLFFLALQDSDGVVGLHHAGRLHEQRRAAGGRVVHQPRHVAAAFRLHRHHIPPVAHGHDGVLQKFLIGAGPNQFVQLLAHAGGRGADFAPDVGQRRRRIVGQLVLGADGSVDLVLQKFIDAQRAEQIFQRRDHPFGVGAPIVQRAHGVQQLRHVQQLTHGQHAAGLGTAQRVGAVDQPAERRRAEPAGQLKRVLRLGQAAAHLVQVAAGRNRPRRIGRVRAGCLAGQPVEDFVQFQRAVMFFS